MTEKRPVGRPSEYEPRHLAFAEAYLTMYEELGDTVPTVEGLADELQVSKKTVYTWAEANPEFLHAIERLKAKQGRLLQSLGLKSKTNPAITKLMLSANHGMAEKTEQDITSQGEKIRGITVEFVRPDAG